jgi:hypothetical protein
MTALCQPKIYLPTGKEYDFGSSGHGELHCKIPIINIGKDTLIIKSVTTSCGCTTAPIEKKVIPASDTSLIYATLNTKHSKGIKESIISIVSSDKQDSNYQIKLRAKIIEDISADTSIFPISYEKKPSKGFTSTIKLTNSSNQKIQIFKPFIEGDSIPVKFVCEPAINPNGNIEFKAIVAKLDKHKSYYCRVIVPTSSKFNPFIELALVVVNQEKITLNKKTID